MVWSAFYSKRKIGHTWQINCFSFSVFHSVSFFSISFSVGFHLSQYLSLPLSSSSLSLPLFLSLSLSLLFHSLSSLTSAHLHCPHLQKLSGGMVAALNYRSANQPINRKKNRSLNFVPRKIFSWFLTYISSLTKCDWWKKNGSPYWCQKLWCACTDSMAIAIIIPAWIVWCSLRESKRFIKVGKFSFLFPDLRERERERERERFEYKQKKPGQIIRRWSSM